MARAEAARPWASLPFTGPSPLPPIVRPQRRRGPAVLDFGARGAGTHKGARKGNQEQTPRLWKSCGTQGERRGRQRMIRPGLAGGTAPWPLSSSRLAILGRKGHAFRILREVLPPLQAAVSYLSGQFTGSLP